MKSVAYKAGKDGLIVKTKARLVAKGLSQVQDVDYFQMFAPALSSVSVKILAAVASLCWRETSRNIHETIRWVW